MLINPQPYGTYLLAEIPSHTSIDAALQKKISNEFLQLVRTAISATGGLLKGRVNEFAPIEHSGVTISGWWFNTKVPVRWEPALSDTKHELLLICVFRSYVAFYASDASLRRVLLSSLGNSAAPAALASLSKISAARLTAAFFINNQLKAMWLAGTHRSVQVKADSKVLSGSDLKYALDPLGDSSYLAAAARQEKMGVSLRGSAVWTKPHRTIISFAGDVRQVFDALVLSGSKEAFLPVLANELSSFADVGSPFDFDVAAPEALRLKSQQNLAAEIASTYSFTIQPCTTSAASAYAFDLSIKPWTIGPAAGPSVLTLQVEPKFSTAHSDSVVMFDVKTAVSPLCPWMDEVINALKEMPELF